MNWVFPKFFAGFTLIGCRKIADKKRITETMTQVVDAFIEENGVWNIVAAHTFERRGIEYPHLVRLGSHLTCACHGDFDCLFFDHVVRGIWHRSIVYYLPPSTH